MKTTFTLALLACLSSTVFSQTWIHPKDAAKHSGHLVNVAGFISEIKISTAPLGAPIVISVNDNDPDRISFLMTVQSGGPAIKKNPGSGYLYQYVQLKGRVRINNGLVQIHVSNPEALAVTRESNPGLLWLLPD